MTTSRRFLRDWLLEYLQQYEENAAELIRMQSELTRLVEAAWVINQQQLKQSVAPTIAALTAKDKCRTPMPRKKIVADKAMTGTGKPVPVKQKRSKGAGKR